MNEETQRKLMEWAEAGIGKINDLATTEIPALIQQYLNWQFWANIAQMVILWGFTAGLVFITYSLYKWSIDPDRRGSAKESLAIASFVTGLFSLILALVTLIATSCNTYECIQIKVAPKVYLIEKATHLLKKN